MQKLHEALLAHFLHFARREFRERLPIDVDTVSALRESPYDHGHFRQGEAGEAACPVNL